MPNQVQPGERGVVLLLVDHREGGGEARKGYWELTRELERQDVRYETRALEPGAGDLVRVRVRVRPNPNPNANPNPNPNQVRGTSSSCSPMVPWPCPPSWHRGASAGWRTLRRTP